MSRYFMVQSWVGSHENEPDYNGNQCGERNVRSSEVAPLYDQYGNANIKAFSDEALQSRKKAPAKTKSAFDSIMLADRNYERLCGLSEALDTELDQGVIDLESWVAARRNIDKRLEKAWERVCKERPELLEPEQHPNQGLDFTLDIEHSSPIAIDYSIIPNDSVFAELQDGNIFKQCACVVLTACKWFAKFTTTTKQLIREGLV